MPLNGSLDGVLGAHHARPTIGWVDSALRTCLGQEVGACPQPTESCPVFTE